MQFSHFVMSLSSLWEYVHNICCTCPFHFCVVCSLSMNIQEFDYGLQMVYFITMDLIRKFHDSCFGFMCKGICKWEGVFVLKSFKPIAKWKGKPHFSNDKLFYVCFPLDVLTFRAPKLFHAQVFYVNTKTFTNQECWLTKELLTLHECTKFWATYNHWSLVFTLDFFCCCCEWWWSP
jgi:hypothetical protein